MGKQDRTAHMHFIQRNLDFLLAQAWDGYQRVGRGAVIVDADRAVPDPDWPGGITPGLYVSRKMLGEAGMDWPDTDIKRMVREYDPDKEIVVAIIGGGDGDYYRFGVPHRSPAQAFAAVGPQLQEMALKPGELERWVEGKTQRR